jgi:cell division protein DivIC
MRFIEIISKKKFALITILLLIYILLNLLDGERGLISYYEKKKLIINLQNEKSLLVKKLSSIEKKNTLLTDVVDIDYLEILYRKKFMVGKNKENIFIN